MIMIFMVFVQEKLEILMKLFPPARIGMDAQGGGIAIEEALHDPTNLDLEKFLIWPAIDESKV